MHFQFPLFSEYCDVYVGLGKYVTKSAHGRFYFCQFPISDNTGTINFKVYGQFSSLTIIMEIIVHHKLICVRKNLAFMFFRVVLFVCFDRFFLLNL